MVATDDYLPSTALRKATDVTTSNTVTVSPGELDDVLSGLSEQTLVKLEPGTYTPRGGYSPVSSCAVLGSTDSEGVPTSIIEHHGGTGKYLFSGSCSGDFAVENLIMDYGDGDGNLGISVKTGGHGLFRNIHFEGFNPAESGGNPVDNLAPQATTSTGTFVVREVIRTGPTDIKPHGSQGDDANEGCIWLGQKHAGDLYICDTRIENTGTNAIYGSRTTGSIHLHRCHLANNNQASVRIGGGQRENTISESVFLIDTANAHPDNKGPYINPTGIVAETDNSKTGVESQPLTVTDTDFLLASGPDDARLFFLDGQVGPVSVENCRLRSEKGACNAFYARTTPRWGTAATDQSISFTTSHGTGDGEFEVVGGRLATWDGCLSAPNSGIDTSGAESANCTTPDTTTPVGDAGGGSSYDGTGGGTSGSPSGGGIYDYLSETGDCEFVNLPTFPSGGGAGGDGASGPPHETITVPAGTTKEVTVTGSESYENKTIDISALGSGFKLTATGEGWTVRNIAVKGRNFIPNATAMTLSGSGTLDTLYMGDGAAGWATAIMVPPTHAGDLTIRNVNLQGFENGVYAGSPGNPMDPTMTKGSNGTVTVDSAYVGEMGDVAYQIGTDGSSITNAVGENAKRVFWGRWNTTEMTNCHAGGETCFIAGNPKPPVRPATVTVTNCHAQCATTTSGPGSVTGSIGSNPSFARPEGVPASAADAIVLGRHGAGAAGEIGGGEGYDDTVAPSEATETVSSASELKSALSSAAAGDVIYVAPTAAITTGGAQITVPSGVTLASNRGIGGAAGGLVQTGATKPRGDPWGMFQPEDNARITGLRVGGPRWDWVDITDDEEVGINADATNATGVVVDNCEIYGWGYAGVLCGDDTHVHHNHIHHHSRMGQGYGVHSESASNPIIEYNHFEHCRHSVASNGRSGYTFRYNIIDGPAISHCIDVHQPGGSNFEIHHNTVRPTIDEGGRDGGGGSNPAVAIRGTPSGGAEIHHNWFYNEKKPRSSPLGWSGEAIIQALVNHWNNINYHDNHYGTDEPGPDIGHPRSAVATGGGTAYYTGDRIKTSQAGGLQAAVDKASAQDIVVVDANTTLSSAVSLKSDLKVEGGGGVISVTGDAKAAFGLYNSLTNVWLDGLTIVGPGQKPTLTGTYGIGGPGGRGPFENFRVTNCTVRDFPNNGISFVVYGTDNANDVYIGGNTVRNCGSHGLLFGCGEVGGSNTNTITNLLVEGNTVNGIDQAQAIGVFGHSGGVSKNCLILKNTVGRQTQDERGATFMSFEEDVHHCAFLGNEVRNVNGGTNLAVTKRAHDNVIANNYSRDGPSGMNVNNYGYYLPGGPPIDNVFTHNHIDNCGSGVHYKNIDSADNVFYHNRITNSSPELNLNAPALTGDSTTPRVWDTTTATIDTGLVDSFGGSATYTTGSGSVGAEITWSRGSPHPTEPVSVTVNTYADRY